MTRRASRLLPVLAALSIVAASSAAVALPVLGGKAAKQVAIPTTPPEPAPEDAPREIAPGPLHGHRSFAAWDSWQLVVVDP